ncbi:MAG TPA: multidrug efflux SMR transporter [Bryobacteraceae bacterium]|nr:multidrug efflux SMR transporter [Bryobacteraceae bacterium]
MAWIYLVVAGLFEIVWVSAMKQSAGFTKPLPSAVTIVTMTISFALLSAAMRHLPMGTAYAVWTGIGAMGAFAIGALLGESVTFFRLASMALILAGIAGLKFSAS